MNVKKKIAPKTAWYKNGTQSWDPGTTKTTKTLGTPRTHGTSQDLQDPKDTWDLQNSGTTSTSVSHGPPEAAGPLDAWTPLGPQDFRTLGKLPLPFEIQNLNTVQLFLICCKKYRNEVSHRYGSVVFLAKM